MKTFNQFMTEAKLESKLSPYEKETVRNKRAFGSFTNMDRETGIRRTIHSAGRGAKKEEDRGEKSIPDTRKEVKSRIEKLKGYRHGRMFSRMVKGDLSHPESQKIQREIQREKAQKYIDAVNSQNSIKRFK